MSVDAISLQGRLRTAATAVDSPVEITVGPEAAREVLAGLPGPVVVVTTPRASGGAVVETLLSGIDEVEVWSGAHAHPGPALIEQTTNELRTREPATVVGLGGGSVLDLTKIATAPLRAAGEGPGLVQISTTAGTGADVTRWGTFWLPDGTKQSFDAPEGFADHALVIPELSESMPPRLTLATGLDAFVHAAEAMAGVHATVASTDVARRAVELVAEALDEAITQPTAAARTMMSEAATLAGLALSVTRSAAAHALSYSLTGVHGLEHGLAVALMWRALVPRLAQISPDEMGAVFAALGVASPHGAEERIDTWLAAGGLRPSLAALGLPARAAADTVEQALRSNRLANQPGVWGEPELRAAIDRVR